MQAAGLLGQAAQGTERRLKRGGSSSGGRKDCGDKRTIDARPAPRGKRPPRPAGAKAAPHGGRGQHSAFKTGDDDRRAGADRGKGRPAFRSEAGRSFQARPDAGHRAGPGRGTSSFAPRDTAEPAEKTGRKASSRPRSETQRPAPSKGRGRDRAAYKSRSDEGRGEAPRRGKSSTYRPREQNVREEGVERGFDKRRPGANRIPAPEPAREEIREAAPAPAFVSTGVQNVVVSPDEAGMRVDRFIEARFPGLSFSHIQRVIRKGEVRVSGKRVDPKDRLNAGSGVRIPPFKQEPPKPRDDAPDAMKTRAFLKDITLFEDDDVMVLNKPYGLAVQGGSGTTRHIDGMLDSMRSRDGQRPRLVHRLDKDTAGCLLVAKSRFAAAALAKNFRHRSARKIYWALVVEVPKPKQGRISTFLAKEQMEEDSFMRIADHGDDGAAHAVTYYAVVETAAAKLAWLSLKPVTGRTHQLRAHLDHIKHPIVGDPKYFAKENWELPGGIQNRLHLLARRLVIPHPRGGTIDVTAPLPPHMTQSWNLLGFDLARYDPIEQAPLEE